MAILSIRRILFWSTGTTEYAVFTMEHPLSALTS